MHNEQIFTPIHVTNTMFVELGYNGNNIRKKHIIDNSCGNGAILKEIVRQYINVCIKCGLSKEEIIEELETYIHGIEIDKSLVFYAKNNINDIAKGYSLGNIEWDIVCADAMDIHKYDNKMDYVIGNPPYCNIHDIPEEKRAKVKSYKFANGGMTDLFLVFFEIGINMLNENGKLAYITPNSWLTSVAGTNFRNYLKESKTLLVLYQYGHRKIFEKVNTYTCITVLSKTPKSNNLFVCYKPREISLFQENEMKRTIENLDECMIDGKIYLAQKHMLNIISDISKMEKKKNRIRVKNGFATLNDKFFIIDDYVEKYGLKKNIIEVTKASNGEKHFFFYPYDKNGKPMTLLDIDNHLIDYMRSRSFDYKVDLENCAWYLYGRTQALNDVKYDKLIINNLIRNIDDFKITIIPEQQGVYSGFYIPLYDSYKDFKDDFIDFIINEDFFTYVKAVGKYKNGGYYSFSSKELESWLNYWFTFQKK